MKKVDVTIIGAGLAGLQCARLLSRQGAKVLLVDRKLDLTKGVHTTGIFVRKTLEDFDFPLGTLGPAIRDVVLYSPKLRACELKSSHDEFRVGKMGLLYDCYLRECRMNGVEVSLGTRFISSGTDDRNPDGLIVTLEQGAKLFEVAATILVGADGANSRVARCQGLDENKEWIVGYEEVFNTASPGGQPMLHCFLDAELAPGYLAWIADDGDEVHVGVGGYARDFDPRAAIRAFKDKIAGIRDLSGLQPVETRGGRIPVGGVLRKISNKNSLLIGDAAGAVSPLTAGGLDPCLRLSAYAANVALERLRTGDAKLMYSYSGNSFRARFVSRIWMRRLAAKMARQSLLEMMCRLLRNRLGGLFARHVFFGRGSFPDIDQTSAAAPDVALAKHE